MRHTSSIALGRPRLAQEWPPGPRTVMRARRLPTASTATCERPWPSSASTWSGCSVSQAERAPARLPRPSSPTVNATATPSAAPCAASCSTTRTAHTTAAALSPIPGPRTRSPSICGSCGTSRANTVSTCASRSTLGRAPSKAQIRLPAVSTTVRPGAPASRRCSHAMRSPSSNVGAGTRASSIRSSRASSAALTPRGRYQAARRPDWPPPERARNAAAASIAASTLKPSSRAWAISITCSTESVS